MLSQVRDDIGDACKTVGSAYVGSNPTPATTQSRRSGGLSVVLGLMLRSKSRQHQLVWGCPAFPLVRTVQ